MSLKGKSDKLAACAKQQINTYIQPALDMQQEQVQEEPQLQQNPLSAKQTHPIGTKKSFKQHVVDLVQTRDMFCSMSPVLPTVAKGDRADVSFTVGKQHVNHFGVCHGAILMAFCDVVLCLTGVVRAVDHYHLERKKYEVVDGRQFVTLTKNINYEFKSPVWTGDHVHMYIDKLVSKSNRDGGFHITAEIMVKVNGALVGGCTSQAKILYRSTPLSKL
jgi:acyl-coenzyme A thioesterase PaaI-like protein